jgi:membrane peptidoglycan carboxypeptidase
VLGLFAVGGGVLGGLVGYTALTLPDLSKLGETTGTITILDRNGQQIAQVGHNQQPRDEVTLAQISPIMQKAILAAEDRNFYNEGAVNFGSIVRALVTDIVDRSAVEGASTITQQLAKQAFFGATAQKTPLRKVQEALLAQEIDENYTKDQILEKYLNVIYFGENAYGIQDAAERYFGVPASQLTLPQAALLAGLPEAPSYYDPFSNPAPTWARMHYVLDGMVSTGAATQAQVDAVDPLVGGGDGSNPTPQQLANQKALLAMLQNGKPVTSTDLAPHFVQYVEDQLNQQFANDPSFLNGNLTVTTTLDLGIQANAQKYVTAGVAKLKSSGANNAALLMIDPNTGNILAMVGSADFNDDSIAGQYNVTTGERQPGSSFKPYVYETGFINGSITPDTILDDTPAESAQLGGVKDWDRSYLGPITAAKSLVESRNISTEQAMGEIGVNNVINFAQSLGITTPLAPNVSTAIGTSAVRMIDQVSAYAAFANGGQKVTARAITKVVSDDGTVLFDEPTPPSEGTVMTPQQAATMTNLLRQYQHVWDENFKYDTASKSGTTDNFVDAWYMDMTPSWVVATWAGHTSESDPAEVGMSPGVYGTSEGMAIAVPFVNSLSKPVPWPSVPGILEDCHSGDRIGSTDACPTPTPTPTPVPTQVPIQTEIATPTGTPCPPLTPLATPSPAVLPTC